MKLFSAHRDWNNHMARSATPDDFKTLSLHLQVMRPAFSESGSARSTRPPLGDVTYHSVITDTLSLVVVAMDRVLVHHCAPDDPDFHLGGYERLFKTFIMGCCPNILLKDHITGRHLWVT
jgi:hypothetical protein